MPISSLMPTYSKGTMPVCQLGKYSEKNFIVFAYRFFGFGPIAPIQCTVVGLSTRPAILIDFQKLFLHNVFIWTKMY